MYEKWAKVLKNWEKKFNHPSHHPVCLLPSPTSHSVLRRPTVNCAAGFHSTSPSQPSYSSFRSNTQFSSLAILLPTRPFPHSPSIYSLLISSISPPPSPPSNCPISSFFCPGMMPLSLLKDIGLDVISNTPAFCSEFKQELKVAKRQFELFPFSGPIFSKTLLDHRGSTSNGFCVQPYASAPLLTGFCVWSWQIKGCHVVF